MTCYRLTSRALAATLSDGAVLLNLHTKRYFSLNETGTRVWTLLQRGTTAGPIIATLLEEYEVDELEARRTVLALLDELAAEGLVEPVECS